MTRRRGHRFSTGRPLQRRRCVNRVLPALAVILSDSEESLCYQAHTYRSSNFTTLPNMTAIDVDIHLCNGLLQRGDLRSDYYISTPLTFSLGYRFVTP